jgi:hypothetical protein
MVTIYEEYKTFMSKYEIRKKYSMTSTSNKKSIPAKSKTMKVF